MSSNPLVCPHCGASVTPVDDECSSCHLRLTTQDGTTIDDALMPPPRERAAVVPKPAPDEMPGWIVALNLALVAMVLILAISIFRERWAVARHADRVEQWRKEGVAALRNPRSDAHIERARPFPTSGSALFFVDRGEDIAAAETLALAIGFHAGSEKVYATGAFSSTDIPAGTSFVVIIPGGWDLSIRVIGFAGRSHDEPLQPNERGEIDWSRSVSRISPLALVALLAAVLAAWGLRALVLERFRHRRLAEWNVYESERTKLIYQAKQHLDESRQFARDGQIAKALSKLRAALQLRPDYDEARELYNLWNRSELLDSAAIIPQTSPTRRPHSSGKALFLRVVGTPYAYRADEGADVIRVGRQRRNPDDPDGEGNDLVIRVPASDERSLRISRQHLEIDRIGGDYFVIDRSEGRSRLNGSALVFGKPVQIISGDHLMLAKVVTLEVSIRGVAARAGDAPIVDAVKTLGRLEIEATVGDMVTEDPEHG